MVWYIILWYRMVCYRIEWCSKDLHFRYKTSSSPKTALWWSPQRPRLRFEKREGRSLWGKSVLPTNTRVGVCAAMARGDDGGLSFWMRYSWWCSSSSVAVVSGSNTRSKQCLPISRVNLSQFPRHITWPDVNWVLDRYIPKNNIYKIPMIATR